MAGEAAMTGDGTDKTLTEAIAPNDEKDPEDLSTSHFHLLVTEVNAEMVGDVAMEVITVMDTSVAMDSTAGMEATAGMWATAEMAASDVMVMSAVMAMTAVMDSNAETAASAEMEGREEMGHAAL
mmetsp:Transcript_35277/g.80775  ORF Transcript_35277/g.80775 Transcript_35277/m.80775 type:complete len:125 (-) Transcript_35277:466-840(-)